jgi:hypothetical protein
MKGGLNRINGLNGPLFQIVDVVTICNHFVFALGEKMKQPLLIAL